MDLNKKHDYFTRHPQWGKMAKNLIDHGLGFMSKEQHDYLVQNGMISCNEKNDSIIAEYPKIEIRKQNGDTEMVDLDGNLDLLRKEIINLKSQGKSAHIVYYPKKYSEYLSRKNEGWKQDEEEALSSLI